MPIATRLTNTGNLLVNGSFDEVTYSSTNPAIYNLVTYTEQFDNTVWSPTAALTITPNSINSPVNTLTADTLNGNGVTVGYFDRSVPFVTGTTYTFSCYFKAGTQSTVLILLYGTYFNNGGANIIGQFNLSTGSTSGSNATAYGMISVGNGRYRCWISQTCTAGTTNGNQIIRLGSATGNLYAWGYQLEVVPTPSSPSIYQGIAAAGILVPPGFAETTTSTAVYVTNIFNEVSDMIVTNGLLLYVNGSSDVYSGTGTKWSDLSTYNNNATLTNSPTYNAGTGGGSFAFNGSTQYAPVTAALLNTTYTGKTVFFVGRLNAAAFTPGVAQFRAMFGSASTPRNFNFYVHQSAANVVDFHYSTSGSAFFTGAVSLGTNWFVAAVTQDATTTKVYLNGTEIYSVAGQTLNQYANGGEEAVAKADNYWYGDVAVCAVYSRALSAAEILNNYNAFAARVGLTPTANAPVERASSDGTMYVIGDFDEFTGAPVVDGNLKAWLDAGQTASYSGTGSIWTDLSGTGNNGTLVNSPTYSSTNGGSLEFNGTNNYINIPSTSSLQFLNRSPYSFEVWVYPISDTSASYPGFINRESNPGTGRDGYNLYYTNLGVAVGSHLIATERFCTGTQISAGATYTDAVFFNNWQCYCTTYDGTTLRFYRNGVLVSSATSTGNITNTTQNVTIGQRSGVYSNSRISNTKFYSSALSADEVTTNFNALRGRYGI